MRLVLGQVVLEGFPEEVTFEQRLNVVRIDVQTDGPGRVPGKENNTKALRWEQTS